jgi:hypothetical protein
MFTIGTDPEFFVKKGSKYINAELVTKYNKPVFSGTKASPVSLPNGGGLQIDNVAVEVAVKPAKSEEEFVQNISNTFKDLYNILPKKFKLSIDQSATFENKQLNTENAQLFGCSPSYCAYKLEAYKLQNAEITNNRSLGGHIHISSPDFKYLSTFQGKIDLVKTLDCLLAIPLILIEDVELSINRRKLYGKAGDHRPTEYADGTEGIEYRTLSPFWLNSKQSVKFIYSAVKDALKIVKNNDHIQLFEMFHDEVIIETINNCNVEIATKLTEKIMPYLSKNSINLYNKIITKKPEPLTKWLEN